MKRISSFALSVFLLFINSPATLAEAPYDSYTYDYYGRVVPSPDPYTPSRIINGESLGIGKLSGPKDIFVSQQSDIYIVDTGNNRIIVTDRHWNLLRVINGFHHNGELDTFNNPGGIFVTKNNHVYVADTTNQRIVELDEEGNLVRIIERPESEILDENFLYMPTSLVLDSAGRIYVIGLSVNQGIIELNSDGEFSGFIGASKVTPSVSDIIWKRISTQEQRKRMIAFVPTEYNNIAIDTKGFLYTVTSTLDEKVLGAAIASRSSNDTGAPIKKLNLQGSDVMRRKGSFLPAGDIAYPPSIIPNFKYTGPSRLVDVCVEAFGGYTVLDSNRGHVFTYDGDGNLMYAFGAPGETKGTFRLPIAIEVLDNRMFVVDMGSNNITEFQVTDYGSMVKEAIAHHHEGLYEEATHKWYQVLKKNANSELAYTGIGKAFLRKGDYGEALRYFKLGHNKIYYSKAFKYYRREVLSENFNGIMVVVLLLSVGIYVRIRYKKRKGVKS